MERDECDEEEVEVEGWGEGDGWVFIACRSMEVVMFVVDEIPTRVPLTGDLALVVEMLL